MISDTPGDDGLSNAENLSITYGDRLRSIAVGASAAAMILVPTIGPVIAGTGEGAEEFDTEITPPDYAFAIWGPIFLASAANSVQHAVDPTAQINRSTGWWLSGAYVANAAWSVAAQSDRFRYTPFILGAAVAFAGNGYRRAQHAYPRSAGNIVPSSAGLLFGWTSVAAVVNAFAVGRNGNPATATQSEKIAARFAIAGAAAALMTTIAASTRGHTSVAVAGMWALATSAMNPNRTTGTRLVNGSAAAAIAGTTAVKLWHSRVRAQRRGRPI